jgi:glycosyltransferase involved in cell wall biosynthesis
MNFDIIIVDDGSPISAAEEIADFKCSRPIKVIKQNNQGAGSARNAALGSLPLNRRYVAFLATMNGNHITSKQQSQSWSVATIAIFQINTTLMSSILSSRRKN